MQYSKTLIFKFVLKESFGEKNHKCCLWLKKKEKFIRQAYIIKYFIK